MLLLESNTKRCRTDTLEKSFARLDLLDAAVILWNERDAVLTVTTVIGDFVAVLVLTAVVRTSVAIALVLRLLGRGLPALLNP